MDKVKGRIVLSTYPDRKSAELAAREIVNEKHNAACMNLIDIQSYYLWKDEYIKSQECLVLFKTTEQKSEELKKDIELSHPYEVPEIVEIAPERISSKYLKWLIDVTNTQTE